ncbi:hypothetical protein G7046_g8789 [Stylonectria norvegica]|nr:hypothetical protein G7046_g8789 [Stylonectria norvegica]
MEPNPTATGTAGDCTQARSFSLMLAVLLIAVFAFCLPQYQHAAYRGFGFHSFDFQIVPLLLLTFAAGATDVMPHYALPPCAHGFAHEDLRVTDTAPSTLHGNKLVTKNV